MRRQLVSTSALGLLVGLMPQPAQAQAQCESGYCNIVEPININSAYPHAPAEVTVTAWENIIVTDPKSSASGNGIEWAPTLSGSKLTLGEVAGAVTVKGSQGNPKTAPVSGVYVHAGGTPFAGGFTLDLGLNISSSGGNDRPTVYITGSGSTGKSTGGVTVIGSSAEVFGYTDAGNNDNGAGIGVALQGGGGSNGKSNTEQGATGGGGGTGGSGGPVRYTTSGDNVFFNSTRGVNAPSIQATTRGGNGGTGGDGGGTGGRGGSGGNGGTITLDGAGIYGPGVTLNIDTSGDNSAAISLLSAGGTGGKGGGVESGGKGGGAAGSGGRGGDITIGINPDVLISTTGNQSPGVLAISQGGNGGEGGTGSSSGESGGAGGVGQGGGDISYTYNDIVGDILSTQGDGSDAVALFSLGGIGGKGGGGFIGPSGSGGKTGNSGDITVISGTTLTTQGIGSNGINAQSVAGHGGASSSGGGLIKFNAQGGSAGAGGDVSIQNTGAITTRQSASSAISALSAGGGGGRGGSSFAAFYASGGSGGQGGAGGAVRVTNSASLQTSGYNATGINAQSIGGAGGSGGSAGALASFGGKGGAASNGKTVTVTNSGTIRTGVGNLTLPTDSANGCETGCSHGILAQSIGGGGGSAGASGGWFSLGGSGNSGGNGGNVTVTHMSNRVTTSQTNSSAILAQSIGGGGGHGGAVAGGGALLSATVGGKGAKGGNGGSVTVEMSESGSVTTQGDVSYGLAGQSIGGGGGAGGFAVDAALSAGPAISFTVGGGSGKGADGGDVTIGLAAPGPILAGPISTAGANATGLFAQSVGGGGGHGGMAISAAAGSATSFAAAIGGTTGGGGAGGTVSVFNESMITTKGDHADAILAQSVGGGGGHGGLSVAAAISTTASVSASVGGSGGKGGAAGAVTVTSSAAADQIKTSGEFSHGVLAQSVGGGGGKGGTAIAGSVTFSGSTPGLGLSFAMGGSGGVGGASDDVSVAIETDVTTGGTYATGILAQSIAGGGGAGGTAISGTITTGTGAVGASVGLGGTGGVGAGSGAVVVTGTGDVGTSGNHSAGITAQSIAGGGGAGGTSIAGDVSFSGKAAVAVSVGGQGGSGGLADTVELIQGSGDITTTGLMSDGVVAQSIGGGGGNGGAAISGTMATASSLTVGVSVGGGTKTAISGGAASAVNVQTGGTITSSGDGSRGIVAQSIGGGGGSGGAALSASLATSNAVKALSVSVGGGGGNGGAGGSVSVTNKGKVTTGTAAASSDGMTGEHGILAQSIGGGGGTGGLAATGTANKGNRSLQVDIGGSGGPGAGSADVYFLNQGAIQTYGQVSHGILAQSIAGGGGDGGGTLTFGATTKSANAYSVSVGGRGGGGAASGSVKATNEAAVTASGLGARGIVMQSIAGGGGNGGSNLYKNQSGSNDPDQISVGVGGFGGKGSDASIVLLDSAAESSITTGSPDGSLSKALLGQMNMDGHGIVLQSIGGGGGSGGAGIQGSVKPGSGSTSADIAVGGFGAGGGAGGIVNAGNSSLILQGDVTTWNANSHGILAQSIGGGGGSGGAGIDGNVTNNAGKGLTVGVGGFGAGGGSANTVTAYSYKTVTTHGDYSKGILAQSIGGGGGTGGVGIQGNISGASDSGTKQLAVGVGGAGGGSNAGGTIIVNNFAPVSTGADGSGSSTVSGMDAIAAQSIGGGGGNSGVGIEGNISNSSQSKASSVTLGYAASAGGGGDGGAVTVNNHNGLTAAGNGSRGILAQSIGGGGGTGGIGIDGNVTAPSDAKSDTQLELGIGGQAGTAGNGNTVTVTNTGIINTGFAEAGSPSEQQGMHGIFAQSVGGGGGAGGIAINGDVTGSENSKTLDIAVGGAGKGGGSAKTVTVRNDNTITTAGDGARGIFAQSIGGGGGDASGLLNGSVSSGGGKALTIAVGASGGKAGTGGAVIVTNSGAITTGLEARSGTQTVNQAHGILAQSIGGGGGTGKLSGGIVYGSTQTSGYERGVSLNLGAASSGGRASEVTVTNNSGGTIITWDLHSHGIFAQAVGGGGGQASGFGGIGTSDPSDRWVADVNIGGGASAKGASGDGGAVTLTNHAAITTHAAGAFGIYGQSIGGGGGTGGDGAGAKEKVDGVAQSTSNAVISANIGGQNASSGNGNTVRIASSGAITTSAEAAAGIYAQSVGGGGGRGAGAAAGSLSGFVTVGGTGSTSGNGGAVIVTATGDIATGTTKTGAVGSSTSAVQAYGIFAQSVGGGGGETGTVLMGPTSNFGTFLDMAAGGDKTSTGTGGDVTVSASGKITTKGNSSVGIFAQSVGGGGGVKGEVGQSLNGALIGSNGGVSAAGVVSVTYNGEGLSTSGDAAHGIFAQSAGGTGDDTSETVKVSVDVGGDVTASGAGAHGIFAQSVGLQRGAIVVTVDSGAVVTGGTAASVTGAENGVAVFLKGGTSNSILNYGRIAAGEPTGGYAIAAEGASTVVTNAGTISGNICYTGSCDLAFGDPRDASRLTLVNTRDGLIEKAAAIEAAHFRNQGTIAPGGTNAIGVTRVTRHFTQSASGALAIDVGRIDGATDLGFDQLLVGRFADLDGEVQAKYHIGTAGIAPEAGVQQFVIVRGREDLSLGNRFSVRPSAVAQWGATQRGKALLLDYEIDFASAPIRAGVNANQLSVSRSLQAMFEGGYLAGEAAKSAEALIALESVADYAAAVDSLGAEIYGDTQISTLHSAREFNDELMSCTARGTAAAGIYRFTRNGQCSWMRLGGAWYDQDGSGTGVGFDVSTFQIAAGAEFEIAPDWHLGGAFSYENKSLDMDGDIGNGDGDYFQLGGVLKRRFGPALLSASLSGGYGSFDIDRSLPAGAAASGDQDIWNVSGRLRAEYAFEGPNWFVTPRIDLGFDHVSANSVQETGGGLALAVSDSSETYYSITPAVEFGGEMTFAGGAIARPHATLGVTHYLGNTVPVTNASFALAPGTVPDLRSEATFDRTYLDLAAGIDIFIDARTTAKLETFGSWSENSRNYGLEARLEIAF